MRKGALTVGAIVIAAVASFGVYWLDLGEGKRVTVRELDASSVVTEAAPLAPTQRGPQSDIARQLDPGRSPDSNQL